MRIIFLNRFYWPDEPATAQLLTDLAESLAATGRDVTVITSNPDAARVPRSETRRGVRIERVPGSRATHAGLFSKALDFLTYHLGAMGRLFGIARRGDTVVAMTDPPLLAVSVWFVAGLRGARLIHWVQDIYPELAIELAGHGWLKVVRPLRNLAWRRAEACVTLGRDMAQVLASAGVAESRLTIIPNWAPTGLTPPPTAATDALRTQWNLAGKFVVAYSGNLGRVHDLDPVLALADALRHETQIAFVFVGSGAQRAALEAEAARRGLAQVHFFPPQPRAALATALGIGDVHLVTLLPGCERYVFPSKLYGVAAVGRPVIVVGPAGCELARLVTEHGFGRAFDRNDIAGLAAEIRVLAADPAECARRSTASLRFAHSHNGAAACDRWLAVLQLAEAC